MRSSTRVVSGLLLAAALSVSSTASAESFQPGSLIIPMDLDYQDAGMLRAYGLVYELLRNGVPVRWVIQTKKVHGDTDFTATAKDVKTGADVPPHGYRGGPFVIPASSAAKALPIVTAWQAKNPAVAVHEAVASFSGDVARELVTAPNIAMHADGNQKIARDYLMAAGIPDSTLDYGWPDTSPDMVTPAEIAGPTDTDHSDGILFDADKTPRYCQLMSMHWAVTDAAKNPETVAEVRSFLNNPVHFFAECQAVNAFENHPNGLFLTTKGFDIGTKPTLVDYYNDDLPFAQIDGGFLPVGGSEPAYTLPAGSAYKAKGITMITKAGTPEGDNDVWMTGYLDGTCNIREDCPTGKVSYLGGHSFSVDLPISKNLDTQGTRIFLNSLFEAPCATATGQPTLTVTKVAPASTGQDTVTFTISYKNAGPGVALGAVLADPLPTGSSFVSATGGGALVGTDVRWDLGNLGAGEAGSVSLTVKLSGFGVVTNTAAIGYFSGTTPQTATSNTTTTDYSAGGGGAGGGTGGSAGSAGATGGSSGSAGATGGSSGSAGATGGSAGATGGSAGSAGAAGNAGGATGGSAGAAGATGGSAGSAGAAGKAGSGGATGGSAGSSGSGTAGKAGGGGASGGQAGASGASAGNTGSAAKGGSGTAGGGGASTGDQPTDAASEESGGCGCAVPASQGTKGGLLLGLALALRLARRRRR